jgi:crotonobetainyl-CoA:carnitine CoA-transferase CaiB-like acyl-CoA transferase
VLELHEVAAHPQVAARRLIETRASGVEVRPAVVMRDGWRRLDPPKLGEHSAEVLAEVGVDGQRFEELLRAGVT